MWLFFGISAIIFTGFNLIYSFKNKNEKWFRFAALSFTALTLCSFYSDGYHANHEQGSVGMCRDIHSTELYFTLSREIITFQSADRQCIKNKEDEYARTRNESP